MIRGEFPVAMTGNLQTFSETIFTNFGPIVLFWRDESSGARVRRIFLCRKRNPDEAAKSLYPGSELHSCPVITRLGEGIQRYLSGEEISFSLERLALEACSGFQLRVLTAEYAIPRGRVSTYGRIAKTIGAPGAGRAVGRALAENPFPIVIPCHRAVRSNGELGGYQGGLEMKRALLKMEGVEFEGSGRIRMSRVFF
jgi:methylated-DNA-[protein]-cysteine S-methyltransferase